MKRRPRLLYIAYLAAPFILAACGAFPTAPSIADKHVPHGIVLVVGDGMGSAHFTLARILRGEDYQIGRLPHVGLVATDAADTLVTDSAAAATAYATGIRTNHGFLGVDPSGAPHRTVVEAAEERGLATGLVSTAAFGDATPAAFAAHVESRRETAVIANQMVTRGIDVLASTGLERFGAGGAPTLEQLASEGGYHAVRSAAALRSVGEGPVLAVFPSGKLDSEPPELPLHEIASWALERLSTDPDGFFLLLEHEGTDSASHLNDSAALEESLLSLDETVGAVMRFARQRGDILVIVASDHETGGLQVGGTWSEPEAIWTATYHSGEAVPVFSDGPGARAFGGFLDNTDVGKALLELVGQMGRP